MINRILFLPLLFFSYLSAQTFTLPDYTTSVVQAWNCYVDSTISGERQLNSYDSEWKLTKTVLIRNLMPTLTVTYTYDANDSLVRRTELQSSLSGQVVTTTVLARNPLKRVERDSILQNTGTGNTVLSVRSYSYDTSGECSEVISYDQLGQAAQRVVYERNSQGKVTKAFVLSLNSVPDTQYIERKTFNVSGQLTEWIMEYWNGGSGYNKYKLRNAYSGSHLDTTYTYVWNSGWQYLNRELYSAPANIDTFTVEYWNGQKFIGSRRYTRTLVQGKLDFLLHEDFDIHIGWTPVSRRWFTYDAGGNHSTTKSESFNYGTGLWSGLPWVYHFYSCDATRTGLDEHPKNSVRVFPVPTTGMLTIESEADVTSGEVMSLSGQLLLKFEGRSVDLSELAPGVYFVKVLFHDGTGKVAKVIRE